MLSQTDRQTNRVDVVSAQLKWVVFVTGHWPHAADYWSVGMVRERCVPKRVPAHQHCTRSSPSVHSCGYGHVLYELHWLYWSSSGEHMPPYVCKSLVSHVMTITSVII